MFVVMFLILIVVVFGCFSRFVFVTVIVLLMVMFFCYGGTWVIPRVKVCFCSVDRGLLLEAIDHKFLHNRHLHDDFLKN